MRTTNLMILLFTLGCLCLASNNSYAHCDTLDGPVVHDAKLALEKGDVTPVLKWVKKGAEGEIETMFEKTLLQRQTEGEAADMKFFETLVRVHRAGEGADFTGLKPAGSIDPAIVKADQAIEEAAVEELAEAVSLVVKNGIKERFAELMEAKKHVDDNVDAGRKYVSAYVEYVHYIEGIHNLATGGTAHHHD